MGKTKEIKIAVDVGGVTQARYETGYEPPTFPSGDNTDQTLTSDRELSERK